MTQINHWSLKSKPFQPYITAERVFTDKECDLILEYCNTLKLNNAELGTDTYQNTDFSVRRSSVSWLCERNDTVEFLYRKFTDCILDANKKFWNFNLDYIATLQYTKYHNVDDIFDYHVDILPDGADYRKLTFSLQLNDTNDYEGCDLVIKLDSQQDIPLSRKKGVVNIFPSFLLHKVTPLISGERNCVVGWVCGPSFR
jgi:PKHD-type hydroxylase